ncbi:hypothetical protein ONZ45_g10781 [Pleurotus djamor]|nr:hypothetical protein ONZ45_g10781 [Pleurotus djamor]
MYISFGNVVLQHIRSSDYTFSPFPMDDDHQTASLASFSHNVDTETPSHIDNVENMGDSAGNLASREAIRHLVDEDGYRDRYAADASVALIEQASSFITSNDALGCMFSKSGFDIDLVSPSARPEIQTFMDASDSIEPPKVLADMMECRAWIFSIVKGFDALVLFYKENFRPILSEFVIHFDAMYRDKGAVLTAYVLRTALRYRKSGSFNLSSNELRYIYNGLDRAHVPEIRYILQDVKSQPVYLDDDDNVSYEDIEHTRLGQLALHICASEAIDTQTPEYRVAQSGGPNHLTWLIKLTISDQVMYYFFGRKLLRMYPYTQHRSLSLDAVGQIICTSIGRRWATDRQSTRQWLSNMIGPIAKLAKGARRAEGSDRNVVLPGGTLSFVPNEPQEDAWYKDSYRNRREADYKWRHYRPRYT